jgi:uncharacterized membrane protein (UPF0127 family)
MRVILSFAPLLRAAGVAVTLMTCGPATQSMTAQAQTAQAGLETLQIVSSGGKTHRFSVEVMRNDEERARGLMFRRFLPADRGMLFDFKVEQPVMMWMKNTYISLDMIFIARDGRIVSIAANTEPLSERTIPSGGPTYGVLEVNGGVAARLGIKAGDRVEHAIFKR